MKLNIPRIFYVNQKSAKTGEGQSKYKYVLQRSFMSLLVEESLSYKWSSF